VKYVAWPPKPAAVTLLIMDAALPHQFAGPLLQHELQENLISDGGGG
jgi:hypothetical protein